MLIQEQLKQQAGFSDVERSIADFILAQGAGLKQLSARQIAAEAYVSPSSVVRLCQKLGYDGYNAFQDAWLAEQEYLSSRFQDLDANHPFDPGEPITVIARKLGALYRETIDDTLALLDPDALVRAVGYCRRARNIYICSGGAQSALAESFAEKMAKIGKPVVLSQRGDVMYFHACNCDLKDCFIVLSYSGETPQTLRVARKLKQRRVNTIAVTSYGSNTLASLFDCVLCVSTRERLVRNLGSFSAHLTALFVMDVLYAGVLSQNYDQVADDRVKNVRDFEIYRHSDNPLLREECPRGKPYAKRPGMPPQREGTPGPFLPFGRLHHPAPQNFDSLPWVLAECFTKTALFSAIVATLLKHTPEILSFACLGTRLKTPKQIDLQ